MKAMPRAMTEAPGDAGREPSASLARRLASAVAEKGGEDVRALDVSGLVAYTDVLLICTARNERMAKAIVDEVRGSIKRDLGVLPAGADGTAAGGWQVLDYLDCVVHVFTAEARERYQLDHLWSDASAVDTGAA